MPIFLTAVHEREREQGVNTNAPNNRLNRDAPGLSSNETRRELEDWDRQDRDDRGTVAERPTEIPPEDAFGGGRVGEDARDAVQLPKSEGEYQ
jgi:hypothetical protein